MYIWIGINVEKQLLNVKKIVEKVNEKLDFPKSLLPLHISLKMSFEIQDDILNNVIETISDFYEKLNYFIVDINEIEMHPAIIWIRMKQNEILNRIHDQINNLLFDKYNIKNHEYDGDYKFHTTLFMSDDIEKIKEAYELVKNVKLPSFLKLENFQIGKSSTGEIGTYQVIKTIKK